MPLPLAPGWLIDYATARSIFVGRNGSLKAKVEAMCATGAMKFCACEKPSFKSNADLRKPFYDDQDCTCNLSHDIVGIASELPDVVAGKKINPSDNSARMIVACAIHNNLAIVSGRSGLFLSPVELGMPHGLVCLTLTQFSAAI